MKNTKKGFTLIELLVVIAIIGVLSAIGLVALTGARGKARDARRVSDLRQIALAMASYADTNGATAYTSACGATLPTVVTSTNCATMATFFSGSTVPTDPQAGILTVGTATSATDTCVNQAAGTAVSYTLMTATSAGFSVSTNLESGSSGIPVGHISVTEAGLAACT